MNREWSVARCRDGDREAPVQGAEVIEAGQDSLSPSRRLQQFGQPSPPFRQDEGIHQGRLVIYDDVHCGQVVNR